MISRFAPSTTGEAHPGTLLAALLVWLDVRSRGGRAVLRLEDLDVTRTKAAWAEQMIDACRWLGLDWDAIVVQSDRRTAHEAALDTLAAAGRLYPCTCSRSSRAGRAGGRRAPDGSWAYDNTCRGRALPAGGWRAATDAIRVRLDDDRIELCDDGGLVLSQTPARDLGDPVVRRRDGVIAYQLAVVVDDHDAAITDVIRGRDIAPSTATQVMLQRLLGMPTPRYRHHFLLLEPPQGEPSPQGDSDPCFAADRNRSNRLGPPQGEPSTQGDSDPCFAADRNRSIRLGPPQGEPSPQGDSDPCFAADRNRSNRLGPPQGEPSPQGDSDPCFAADRNRSIRLGPDAGKLAKLHGSIPCSLLRTRHDGPALCGILAHAAGLAPTWTPCRPAELVAGFDWRRIPTVDRIARWDEHGLSISRPPSIARPSR